MEAVLKKVLRTSLAVAACLTAAVVAYAAVIFDSETGEGFVGKGDVQLVYGWNNKQLQANAENVEFRVSVTTETVTTWTCSRFNPSGTEVVTPRNNEITTTTQEIVSTVARENSKGKDGPVTGFNLMGYDGDPVVESEEEGQPIGSCPAGPSSSPFTFVEGSLEETATMLGGGLEVSIDGVDWLPLPITPLQ